MADALAQAIHQIQTWGDLAIVRKKVRAAHRAGQIDQEQVESLAALAAQEGHCLPEWKNQGFYRLDSPEGEKIMKKLNLTAKEQEEILISNIQEVDRELTH